MFLELKLTPALFEVFPKVYYAQKIKLKSLKALSYAFFSVFI